MPHAEPEDYDAALVVRSLHRPWTRRSRPPPGSKPVAASGTCAGVGQLCGDVLKREPDMADIRGGGSD